MTGHWSKQAEYLHHVERRQRKAPAALAVNVTRYAWLQIEREEGGEGECGGGGSRQAGLKREEGCSFLLR